MTTTGLCQVLAHWRTGYLIAPLSGHPRSDRTRYVAITSLAFFLEFMTVLVITASHHTPVTGPRSINPASAGGFGNVDMLKTNNSMPDTIPKTPMILPYP
jgi:hypothetical protein